MSNENSGQRRATFKLEGEDYTLAQALRVMLDRKYNLVTGSGYN